jgi:succinyl-diaminopimelate desuccinylase
MEKTYILSVTVSPMDVVNVLKDLIAIESHTDGRPIISHVTNILTDLGAHVTHYGPEQKPAILAEFGTGGPVFSGHLDTVVMGEWNYEQGQIINGNLYGRGSTDMKSGCAAMIAAAETLKDDVPFSVAFTTDEEIGMKGAEDLARTEALKKSSIVLIGEPTGLKVGTGEKGVLWLEGVVRGKPSHGSMPWMGDNAILTMVQHLKSITPYTQKEGMTINVGLIEGGSQINVTADTCTAQFDVRYPPTIKKEDVIQDMETLTGLPLAVKYDLPPISIDSTRKDIQLLLELAPGACTCYFATEAVKFSPPAPVVILGPGEQEMAHQKNEYVNINQVRKAEKIYTEYFKRMSP